jgi:hypothetical protein
LAATAAASEPEDRARAAARAARRICCSMFLFFFLRGCQRFLCVFLVSAEVERAREALARAFLLHAAHNKTSRTAHSKRPLPRHAPDKAATILGKTLSAECGPRDGRAAARGARCFYFWRARANCLSFCFLSLPNTQTRAHAHPRAAISLARLAHVRLRTWRGAMVGVECVLVGERGGRQRIREGCGRVCGAAP